MDKELFDGLMLSIKQAGAIARGDMKPSRTFTYKVPVSNNDLPKGLKAIREKTELPQELFAEKLQISPK